MAQPNALNAVQMTDEQSNMFDLSHDVKLTLDMGTLIPNLALECVPGDKFNISCESLIRFAPLIAPVMHRIDVSVHYFFVPNRLIWSNWDEYITGVGTHQFPYITVNEYNSVRGSVLDYFGIPPAPATKSAPISALPFAAYAAIYNEYYRDQNLSAKLLQTTDGGDYLNNGDNSARWDYQNPQRRSWEHDYFTSALPNAQQGSPVTIPSTLTDLPVRINSGAGGSSTFTGSSGNAIATKVAGTSGSLVANEFYIQNPANNATVNDLRRAFKLQEFLEKMARGGKRYKETILAQFGVHSSDSRLQRPEYITGIKTPVIISEVLNTSGKTGELPQGNMAGHAIAVTNDNYGDYYCEEHGYIIGIMSIMPKSGYSDGIPKHFLKTADYLDFYWPSFAHLGEQAIQNQELTAYCTAPTSTFGYIPRYTEYKYMPNRIAGDFRTTLDHWHLGRQFTTGGAAQPLNGAFVQCTPRKDIFAVTSPTEHSIYAQIYHKINAYRKMPKFGTPSIY